MSSGLLRARPRRLSLVASANGTPCLPLASRFGG